MSLNLGANSIGFVKSLFMHRSLVYALTKREVSGRYKGSLIGISWSVITPLAMLAIYTFVFSYIFQARWNVESNSKAEFALALFAGLIAFNVFAECINKASTLIIGNVNYVKKVMFPIEILPWVSMGTALFHAAISLVVWMVTYYYLYGVIHWTWAYVPLVFFPIILFVMGISWFFSSLGVFLRDISQLITILTTMVMFLSPVFYPATALPEEYRFVFFLNPLTPMIEQLRNVLLWGLPLDFMVWAKSLCIGLVFSVIGYFWFQKTRKGFADVL